ncbi:MAG: UDP-3-O-(3-hydroxymyristoyl)glucosamine N-acyltransferase [Desulfohalobiaceae bacterium]|nr:UDP-3-O-(3-hydroxymyristoyl)glucosamine N-acyltransferase [Desulfohalobiaceae bacterium]
MTFLLSELAEHLGCELQGDDIRINGCNTLELAGADEISFLANPKYAARLNSTRAGAVVLAPEYRDMHSVCLITSNPYLDFAKIMRLFSAKEKEAPGISEFAFVHPEAHIEENSTIHPFVSIGPRAVVRSGSVIHSGTTLEQECHVGRDCRLYANVTLMHGTQLGDRVTLHSGVVLGSDGFGFAQSETGPEKVPQMGRVVVESDVEIGANSTVDRGTLGETRVGQGSKIDNQVQLGHNVTLGRNVIVVAQVGIAGSTTVEDNVVLAGQVGVSGHLTIGSGSRVGAKTGIHRNVKPGSELSGYPAMEHRDFLRFASIQPKLPEMYHRLKRLEAECDKLRAELERKETSK